MRNRIDIDHAHSRAIAQEIGERLRAHLRDESEPSASLQKQIDRLRELDGQSPSTTNRRYAARRTRTQAEEIGCGLFGRGDVKADRSVEVAAF
jgi:hypothetical protein